LSNIFDTVSEDDIVTLDDSVDYVAELVGEGKKFKEIKDLAKGKKESDLYIEVLTKKLDDAVKELNTRTSLDTFLDKMKSGQQQQEPIVTPTPSGQTQDLDDSVLEQKLAEILSKREQQTSAQKNMTKVIDSLTSQFGGAEQAKLVINHKAKEVGMTPQALRQIAEQSPDAFFRLVGITEAASAGQAPQVARNGVNSFGQEQNTVLRDSKYYEKMKLNDPKAYWDKKTTSQMMKDMALIRSKGLPW
jgi:hypothetical protein